MFVGSFVSYISNDILHRTRTSFPNLDVFKTENMPRPAIKDYLS